jgi:hypothetical protein
MRSRLDSKLRSFLTRAIDSNLDDPIWLESIAALLGERPLNVWSDEDRARFEVDLSQTARLCQNNVLEPWTVANPSRCAL